MKVFASLALLLSAASSDVFVLGAPKNSLSLTEFRSNAAKGLRLLELEGDQLLWKTEEEKIDLLKARVHFFDITDTYELEASIHDKRSEPTEVQYADPSHQSSIEPLLKTLSIENMQNTLATLSAFHTRYYKSPTGKEASDWILNHVTEIAAGRENISTRAFAHPSFDQYSIIARFKGHVDPNAPLTIVGAHMDSVNWGASDPITGRSPGSDDDGTGTVNNIEVFRALVEGGFKPSTPVEFHWYAAEEVGLVGSNGIATKYKADGVEVKGFLQVDMTAYTKPGLQEIVGLNHDSWTNVALNEFITKLGVYTTIPVSPTRCGYGCSDHASWYRQGYPATMLFEGVNTNPTIHSAQDALEAVGFSWDHSLEFVKVILAFVYELSA
ncbi:hypothetical protein ONZ45_g8260 [Pleurotus djamor]|nr:hypothetical protein ONZ45_g8260 [Pleurotus djamor]